MRRFTLALLTAFVSAPIASATAAQPTHVQLQPVSFVLTGACEFSVDLTDLRLHARLMDFVDKTGEFKRAIAAGDEVVKVTNLQTGKSIVLNISGQYVLTPNSDGSLTLTAHGRFLFVTVEPEPFVESTRGRAVLNATVSGEMLALVMETLNGQSVDICQALSAPE
jgi:hypothetical protein